MFWFKSRKKEFDDRISDIEMEIKNIRVGIRMLNCKDHKYRGYENEKSAYIECVKCGRDKNISLKEWREIELKQARDDFDHARDEVSRLEREASDEQS